MLRYEYNSLCGHENESGMVIGKIPLKASWK